MGENGRARVLRELTWDRVADRFLEALEARMGGGLTPAASGGAATGGPATRRPLTPAPTAV
jgi:hypothetical protein